MSNEIRQIIPSPQGDVQEIFSAAQVTREFYDEVGVREDFQRYCQWYRASCALHRQELEKMRGEFNFFRFFRRSEKV